MIKRFCDICGEEIKSTGVRITTVLTSEMQMIYEKKEISCGGLELCDKCNRILNIKVEGNRLYIMDLLIDDIKKVRDKNDKKR